MSKIYVFNGKIYTEEKLMKNNKWCWDNYYPGSSIIEIYELSEVSDLKELVTGLQKTRERDIQLTALLDENGEYKDMFSFISIYKENVESDEVLKEKNPSWTIKNSKKYEILKKFKEIGLDNIKFKNLLKREREYFLTNVDNSVEYFTAYLKVNNCTLDFYKYKSFWEKNSMLKLSDETKINFEKAKKSLLELKKDVSL